MKTINICAFIMIAVVVSFMGFCVENMWRAFAKGCIDNRNMCLPFLLGYGIAMLLVYVLFGLPHRPLFFGVEVSIQNPICENVYYYVMLVLCISIGEIALGSLVEKICGFQWWDYSRIPLHITQYTSIPTSMGYSAIVFVFMRYCFEWLKCFFESWGVKVLVCSSVILGIALTIDMLYNLYLMYRNGSGKLRWRIMMKKKC